MKIGDTVRLKGTALIGKIVDIDDTHEERYWVRCKALSSAAVRMSEDDIELAQVERER